MAHVGRLKQPTWGSITREKKTIEIDTTQRRRLAELAPRCRLFLASYFYNSIDQNGVCLASDWLCFDVAISSRYWLYLLDIGFL
jgi:hypothetical protein